MSHLNSLLLFHRRPDILLNLSQTVYFGAIDELSNYFSARDVEIPNHVNPAEFMIDVVSGDLSKGRDWAKVWSESEEHKARMAELEQLKKENQDKQNESKDDKYEYASTTGTQLRLVTKRASIQVCILLASQFLTSFCHFNFVCEVRNL